MKRCRDVFCTADHVVVGGKSRGNRLTAQQVQRVISGADKHIRSCLVQARRRDPYLSKAYIEFVVRRDGRVLATRVNGNRRSLFAHCLYRQLKKLRFPRSAPRRTVASYTLTILH